METTKKDKVLLTAKRVHFGRQIINTVQKLTVNDYDTARGKTLALKCILELLNSTHPPPHPHHKRNPPKKTHTLKINACKLGVNPTRFTGKYPAEFFTSDGHRIAFPGR